MLDTEYDPYGYHVWVLKAFASTLKTNELRKMAINILKEMVKSKRELKKELNQKRKNDFDVREKIEYFSECIFFLYIDLNDVSEGINFFKTNCIERDKKNLEYVVLDILKSYELYDEWIKEYESNNVNYRKSLQEEYEKN